MLSVAIRRKTIKYQSQRQLQRDPLAQKIIKNQYRHQTNKKNAQHTLQFTFRNHQHHQRNRAKQQTHKLNNPRTTKTDKTSSPRTFALTKTTQTHIPDTAFATRPTRNRRTNDKTPKYMPVAPCCRWPFDVLPCCGGHTTHSNSHKHQTSSPHQRQNT